MTSLYDIEFKRMNGETTTLGEYRGKAVLIVNVASKCGFTRQYEGLQKLYEQFKEEGFVIVGFPCNQFGGQEPGTNEEVQSFCSLNYGVTFPLQDKIEVRGPDAHPLFRALTEQAPFRGFDPALPGSERMESFLKEKLPDYWEGDGIKWNFTKFLLDREGRVVGRFEPVTEPEDIAPAVRAVL